MKNLLCIFDFICERNIIEAISIVILVSMALYGDIKEYKIKNKLNLSFILWGILYNMLMGNLKLAFWGLILPLVLFPLFAVKMIGAGDIKLFCAIGAMSCFPHIVWIMGISILLNGLIAVLLLFKRRSGGFGRLWNWFKLILYSRKFYPYQELSSENKGLFRYAYGIFIGGICYAIKIVLEGDGFVWF